MARRHRVPGWTVLQNSASSPNNALYTANGFSATAYLNTQTGQIVVAVAGIGTVSAAAGSGGDALVQGAAAVDSRIQAADPTVTSRCSPSPVSLRRYSAPRIEIASSMPVPVSPSDGPVRAKANGVAGANIGTWQTTGAHDANTLAELARCFRRPPILALILVIAAFDVTHGAGQERNSSPRSSGGFVSTVSGCEVWIAKVSEKLTISWSGMCTDGRASGAGVLDAQGPAIHEHYEGQMVNGKPTGHGTFTATDGRVLSGQWENGTIEGKVIYSRADGFHYGGGWKNETEEGVGLGIWPSGGRYEGEWANGEPSGAGTMTYASGIRYTGAFRHGKPTAGHGKVTFPNGSEIEGVWDDDLKSGRVTYVNSRGDRFDGVMKNLRRVGQGTLTTATGDRYEGEWEDNVPNGPGTLTKADGSRFSGIWIHGCLRDGERRMFFFVKEASCQ